MSNYQFNLQYQSYNINFLVYQDIVYVNFNDIDHIIKSSVYSLYNNPIYKLYDKLGNKGMVLGISQENDYIWVNQTLIKEGFLKGEITTFSEWFYEVVNNVKCVK